MHRIGLVVATALTLLACGKAAETPAESVALQRVHIAQPESGPAAAPLQATGVVAFRDETRLAFMSGGIVRDILVREGDSVKAGQKLATLETTQVDAAATQAREGWLKAQRDLERGKQLFADDVITREQLDDLNTAERVARAGLSAADFNRNYAVITAPGDGRVLRRFAEVRETVGAGQPVLGLGDVSSGMVLRLGLPDRDAVRVRKDDPATLYFDAFPGKRFEGRVIELSQSADSRTGTYRADVAFDAGTTPFVSGLIGRAEIAGTALGDEQLQYIPLSALVEGDQRSMLVFLLPQGGDQVKAARVAVAFVTGDRAALTQPLPAGHAVITDGAAYLRDGERVEIVTDTATQ